MTSRPSAPETFLAEHLLHETPAGRRNVDKFLATGPEEDRRDEHGHARDAESPARSPVRVCQHERAKNGRDERAGVDRKIEPAKDFREQVLVRFAELIADVGRDARLDPAGAQRDQPETDGQHLLLTEADAPRRVHEGERQMSEAVNDRKPQDRVVFPEKPLRQDGAQNGKEINSGNKSGEPGPRFRVAHGGELPHLVHEIRRHEHGEDRAHPVERETLGRFVPDDVGDARRHRADVRRLAWRIRCLAMRRSCLLRVLGFIREKIRGRVPRRPVRRGACSLVACASPWSFFP